MAEEEVGFPGENEEVGTCTEFTDPVDNAVDNAPETPVEEPVPETAVASSGKSAPWFVAVCEIDEQTEEPIIGKTVQHDFKLQIEADKWIKNNAQEDVIYISLRRGKMLRAKIVRKLEEI